MQAITTSTISVIGIITGKYTSRSVPTSLKVPVVLAERTIQIVVESDIPLNPGATEIKRVKKHVFLDQVKLVPVEFVRIAITTDYHRSNKSQTICSRSYS